MSGGIPDSVMEAAVGWFDDLRGEAAMDREAFIGWLMRSPTHIEAFLTVATLHGGLSAARPADRDWLESLIVEARANVVSISDRAGEPGSDSGLPVAEMPSRIRAVPLWRRWGLAAVIVAGVSLLLLSFVETGGLDDDDLQYVTALGEQRAVVLEDGSVMQLNTDSAVEVRYLADARELVLLRGEAMFDVRKDPVRPFRVNSGEVRVQAIGTRFNVYRHTDRTVVTVIEGQVAVEPTLTGTPAAGGNVDNSGNVGDTGETQAARVARVELSAGEQLAMAVGGAVPERPVSVDTQRATAWTQRRVVFDEDPLADVIAEFNRYNRTKLAIDDIELRERRISGIFSVDDPRAFADVLASMAPVQVVAADPMRLTIVPLERKQERQ